MSSVCRHTVLTLSRGAPASDAFSWYHQYPHGTMVPIGGELSRVVFGGACFSNVSFNVFSYCSVRFVRSRLLVVRRFYCFRSSLRLSIFTECSLRLLILNAIVHTKYK